MSLYERGMKLHYCIWMFMKAYGCTWSNIDGIWKINVRIWMSTVVNEYSRKCKKLCDAIGIYTMSYGCIWAHMDVCESIWWYRNINGSKWKYM